MSRIGTVATQLLRSRHRLSRNCGIASLRSFNPWHCHYCSDLEIVLPRKQHRTLALIHVHHNEDRCDSMTQPSFQDSAA
ncbi:hypothetical protein PHLGIDRAFT_477877 [Phlebiopsis gigantea 11061_1 CR5-6]|uniref:Uncharacterized protein n=1 Tax=Phlebiopsis gigantea (strain 11061_1 CR5-6) TaxID=745531 RepID=A0A0C3S690_PHLG1|nr:hypothetical protein PHLGIDRAFT_477877 [Phlebiopsis gigantea 11061_1 CR5-6]